MMHPWHELSPGAHPPEEVNVVVEIPQGSRNKYELDKPTGLFRLDRVLFSAIHYPGEYGLVPRTIAEDGDPLDALVLVEEPTFPGCIIPCRPIGLLRIVDRGELDDKIVAIPCRDPLQAEHFDIADVPPHKLREIEHFFAVYKELEGHAVETLGWEKSEAAFGAVLNALDRYRRTHAPPPAGGKDEGFRAR